MLDNWQRIEKIVNWTGLSVNAFARCIGLKRAENLYQIKKGNYGISKELAEMITAKYTTVNKSWLLTGAGTMFIDENQKPVANIPYYKIDAVRMMTSQETFSPSSFLCLPNLEGCEFAAITLANAMDPEIPVGAILFFRKAEVNAILPGNIYLIVSTSFGGIRYIRRQPGSHHLKLVPKNTRDYDEVEIEAKEIQRLYEVKGFMILK